MAPDLRSALPAESLGKRRPHHVLFLRLPPEVFDRLAEMAAARKEKPGVLAKELLAQALDSLPR
jgi:hypothetical protein